MFSVCLQGFSLSTQINCLFFFPSAGGLVPAALLPPQQVRVVAQALFRPCLVVVCLQPAALGSNWRMPDSLGLALTWRGGLVRSSDPGERYRGELAPGRATLGGPGLQGRSQTKTPARRYAVRWQPHQPTILQRTNNPPRRNPFCYQTDQM